MITKAVIPIKGIHCASCVRTIESAFKNRPGVIRARVNFPTETAYIDYDDAAVN